MKSDKPASCGMPPPPSFFILILANAWSGSMCVLPCFMLQDDEMDEGCGSIYRLGQALVS